jgi:hypothetical protein
MYGKILEKFLYLFKLGFAIYNISLHFLPNFLVDNTDFVFFSFLPLILHKHLKFFETYHILFAKIY